VKGGRDRIRLVNEPGTTEYRGMTGLSDASAKALPQLPPGASPRTEDGYFARTSHSALVSLGRALAIHIDMPHPYVCRSGPVS
jgi:hypothetical protein